MAYVKQYAELPQPTVVYTDVRCDRCTATLPTMPGFDPSESMQYDNALIVRLNGGYGMFVDDFDRELGYNPSYDKVLCHDCAHDLANWLGIDAHNWHTHREGAGQHRDHHDRRGE